MELFFALSLITLCIIAFIKEKCAEGEISQNKIINKAVPVIVCFVISLIFSITLDLCPFNTAEPGIDSSVFLYIGKAMCNGAVPYKDLFDHKGILLYFIQFFGYLIGFGSQVGVWIIEILNITATAFIFYKICKLFSKSDCVCYFAIATVLLFCTEDFFQGGNLVEEYALPWIALSLYIICKFFVEKSYKNWHIAVIGVGFAIVFFLRVNMVGVWVGLLLPVVIFFIKNKRFSELYKAVLWFLAGFASVTAVVLVYLLATNSVKEMIDCYLIFNFSYVDSASKLGIITFFFDCVGFAWIASFFVVYSLFAHSKSTPLRMNLISLLFAYLSAAISGRAYPHYGIILIPFFVIPAVLFVSDFLKKASSVKISTLKKSLLIFVCVFCLSGVISDTKKSLVRFVYPKDREPDEVVEYVLENTDENDDVLVLGNEVSYYFKFNRQTKNKFFYQSPPIEVSDEIYKQFIAELAEHPSDCIIVPKPDYSKEGEPTKQTIISNQFYYEYETLGIYQLKEYEDYFIYTIKER